MFHLDWNLGGTYSVFARLSIDLRRFSCFHLKKTMAFCIQKIVPIETYRPYLKRGVTKKKIVRLSFCKMMVDGGHAKPWSVVSIKLTDSIFIHNSRMKVGHVVCLSIILGILTSSKPYVAVTKYVIVVRPTYNKGCPFVQRETKL